MGRLKKWLIGTPMATKQLQHETLTKRKALAVFSSDALSSVAYATEEILLVLSLITMPAYFYSLPIAVAITVLLITVTISYRQIIHQFPTGGGAYVVAREFIGPKTSLTAGAALLIDYVLTVAVSISSATAALSSAFPALRDYKVEIALLMLLFLTIVNLRGVRESASVFAIPTYVFVASVLLMLAVGLYNIGTHGVVGFEEHAGTTTEMSSPIFIFLILRAFSSGCSALTGIEAISNGVPSFKPPSSKNAVTTMVMMSLLLGTMFLGVTFLAYGYGILPDEHETVISQIAKATFGQGVLYYFVQIFTMLILFLAANTAYAGFPQLSFVMASDDLLPHSLTSRGARLVFSNGIVILSVIAGVLITLFGADTHALIPLYAVGVFLAFTIGQYGMLRGLLRSGEYRTSQVMTLGLGTIVTGIVTVTTSVAKFSSGAWIVLIAIPLMILMFSKIRSHYMKVARQLKVDAAPQTIRRKKVKMIIPISGVSKVVVQSIEYAKSVSNDIIVVSICASEEQKQELHEKWKNMYPDIPFVTIVSKYRSTIHPLLLFIDHMEKQHPDELLNVVIPQFYVKKWRHNILHTQSGAIIRALLLWKKNTIVSTIPYHLDE